MLFRRCCEDNRIFILNALVVEYIRQAAPVGGLTFGIFDTGRKGRKVKLRSSLIHGVILVHLSKRALIGLPVGHIDSDNSKANIAQQFKGGAWVTESARCGIQMAHQNNTVAALRLGHGMKTLAGRHDLRGSQSTSVKRRAKLFNGHC
jgi:hypothetical protein